MNIVSKQTITSEGPKATEQLGFKVGSLLRGGEVLELIGDVGAGKTTFVKGLARGLGSKDLVTSPTFTVHKVYRGRLILYHYDFYRLQDDPITNKDKLIQDLTKHVRSDNIC